ncbi:methyltransferase domain-containing protein [Pelagovum pacificum]|uniref:Methyltransferase domain-containing protein n=1 Tax=Pelagovum pacificum TaxID=2588711 RepID=A0A5C5GKG2_9RHOB|nr:methyltransferase domain-containing protein [Pelagovum pacificum]QQA42910.1 methyltransferase domain-containing protein [Pelagovum pacificum]TNY33946.1 methyltransferase domain-containing protein [Pelagovum pacificum]
MTDTPRLTDRDALLRNRQKAARAPATFLLDALADETEERLEEVNRTFSDQVVVTGWPEFWSARRPSARIVADTPVLDVEENSADLVIHALSLHWADDPVGQLVQARHALRPDGLLLASLFGGQTLHELRASLAEAEARVTGGLSPRVAPMGEVRDLGALLHRAGFALPVADTTPYTVTYETPLHLMRDLRAMGEQNALFGRLRKPTRRAVLMEAMAIYADRFAQPDGRIPATFEIVTLTGWAPDESQPKPLRPGSAKSRLADALETDEMPLDRED